MKRFILVDYEKCHGCNSCTLACSFAKTKEFNPTRANVTIVHLPDQGNLTFPVLCQNCLEPACLEVCPAQAITRDEESGVTSINEKICMGCKLCVMACPIGGPWVDVRESRIMKCDLCEGDPKCVKYCGFEALQFVSAEEATYKKRKEGAKKLSELLKKQG
jgi:Fe-S-cluster-containing hydrogenase component 2